MMKNKVNIICTENIKIERLVYIIDFINNHPLKPSDIHFVLNDVQKTNLNILYSKNKEGETAYFVPAQNYFFTGKPKSTFYANQYIFGENSLYSVENSIKKKTAFYNNGEYGFDIFETIFFHVSRYEELYCSEDQLDFHKRMKSSEQLLVKNKIHRIPVVDLLVYHFFKSLGLEVKKIRTTYSISHDIDIIRKYKSTFSSFKSVAKVLQMGLGLSGAYSILKSIVKRGKNPQNDPYFTYDWLFVNNPEFVNKTVYFVAGGDRKYDLYDKDYFKELPEIIRKAKEKSYKIGYHPSYDAYNNKKLFKEEFDKLNKLSDSDIVDIRTHYLRLDLQKTFEIIEQYGFRTDSTLGFADDIGFRCGTGFEYNPYNFAEERAWKFREIPLVFMDSSLKYNICKNQVKCFKQKAKQFFENNQYGTHIMINFHNSSFDYSLEFNKGLKEYYLQLISGL